MEEWEEEKGRDERGETGDQREAYLGMNDE